jgi:putative DNA primase/helicase
MTDANPNDLQEAIGMSEKIPYLPIGYKIEDGTLYRMNDDAEIAICDPLYVESLARDANGDNWGRLLSWCDADGGWHEWAMPNSMLAGDGADYRRILLSQGLGIRGGKKAQNALHDYILTAKPPTRAISVSMVGWCGNRYVALDGTVYGDGNDKVLLQVAGTLPKIEHIGTLQGWQDHVARYATGNSRLVFALSSAFAGVMLYPSNEGSGGFHFAGGSSTGKTTTLRLASSAWGVPLRSWRTTDNAAESWARGANDGFLAIDELGQIDGRAADAMAYMLGNGQTKGRASRDGIAKDTAEFRLLFLSTGEIGLADKLKEGGRKAKAGQTVRMIEISADAGAGMGIFENLHGFESADVFAKYLARVAQEYRGTAVPAFLQKVTAESFDTLQSAMSTLTTTWMQEYCPNGIDGQVTRVARRFALVAVVGELAASWGILPWPDQEASKAAARCFKDWLKERGGVGSYEIHEGLQAIITFIERYSQSRFADFDSPDISKINDRAGFRRKNGNEWEYMIFPETFKVEILGGSKNLSSILRAAADAGLIEKDGEGKNTKSITLPELGKKRMYCVFPSRFKDGGGL